LLPLRDPLLQDAYRRLLPPGDEFLLGTDNFGRDVFSRIIYGSRSSLYIAFISVALGTVLGTVIGTTSAFRGGWIDLTIQRVTDMFLGFPLLVLAIIVIVALNPSIHSVMIALSLGVLPQMIRLARSRSLSVREETFIIAAQARGLSSSQIILKHILPHTTSPVLAYATGYVGVALIAESALHFLGLGVPPPQPSWGVMLYEGQAYMEVAPWLTIIPGIILSITAFCFVYLGDALRDFLDPRYR
jgi:peptide/nickel transport system permease protein